MKSKVHVSKAEFGGPEEPDNKWDRRFMTIAVQVSMWSCDPRTRVGAVIVGTDNQIVSTGYNGFARGIEYTNKRLKNKNIKLAYVCHSERNALDNMLRTGGRAKNCRLYVTLPPCVECSKSIIQAGITEVIVGNFVKEYNTPWMKNIQFAYDMLEESGVKMRFYTGVFTRNNVVMIDGKTY